jgi:hypothetical protein
MGFTAWLEGYWIEKSLQDDVDDEESGRWLMNSWMAMVCEQFRDIASFLGSSRRYI